MKNLKALFEVLPKINFTTKQMAGLLPIMVIALLLSSCSSVRVAVDYERSTDFNKYKVLLFINPA
jgi:hypothetical protein